MTLISNLFSTLFPSFESSGSQRDREREIDASMRWAVLVFVKASVVWLLLSSILGFIVSLKLVSPNYLSEYAFFTFGRVYPAFWNVLVYGWLINAGLACVAWIAARLSGRAVGGVLLAVAAGAWNLAVLIGLVGILKGDLSPYRMLEFPAYASPLLIVAFAAIGVWAVLAFKARAYRSSFASQWYFLAAVFSFVWIYTIAQVMVFIDPAQSVYQSVVAAWYRANLFGLVVAPFALATIYYLLPKALGRPVIGYRQSGTAFWSWIAFTSCSGLASLVNGPFPAWVATIGVVASFALFLPLSVFTMQFVPSLLVSFVGIWDTISMRYVLIGVISFIVSTLLIIFGSLREVQEIVQFSQFDDGLRFLFLVGFAGMVFTGGIYFILPRVLHKELPSSSLADLQFWLQGLGIATISMSMIFGGFAHGSLMNGSVVDTVTALETTGSYLFIATLGSFIFLCGSLMFAVSFFWMLFSSRTGEENSADLIKSAPDLEYTPS